MNQALIVGLGMFGMSIARELTLRGFEVIGADRNQDLVEEAADYILDARCIDATDEGALIELRPDRRDFSVCAIGEDARDASIVSTALLRQLGSPKVVARASDPIHARILRLVGAHEVVNPERAFGERLAGRLAFAGVLDQVPLGSNLEITEILVPDAFLGESLQSLALPTNYGLVVVAVREPEPEALQLAAADRLFQPKDVMIIAGPKGAAAKMLEKLK